MSTLSLPPNWDFRLDLLVLVGSQSAEVARMLWAKGQERLYVVALERDPILPAEVPCVPTPSELFFPIVSAKGPKAQNIIVHLTGESTQDQGLSEAVVKITREAIRSREAQAITLHRNGATWLSQGLANMPALARFPAVSTLFNKFEGRTAIVCAPGPSLSDAIPHLRANRSGCLIIAVSHALHSLKRSGISPDIVLAADPGNLDRHFTGVEMDDVGAMVVAVTSRASLFEVSARSHFHFAGNGQIDDWLYRSVDVNAHLPSGGSVTCSAASLALKMGCRRIVFCGLDLSFPKGRFYASESLDGDARVQEENGKFFLRKEAGAEGSSYTLPDGGLRFSADQKVEIIPSADGKTVSSSAALCVYRTWFEALAQSLRGEIVFVQTSRHGAYIDGFEHNPIQGEAERAPRADQDFGSVVAQVTNEHDSAAVGEQVRAYFAPVLALLPDVADLTRALSSFAAKVASNPELLPDLQRGEQELSQAMSRLELLQVVTHRDMQQAEEDARHGKTLADNMRASRRIFGAIERAARLAELPLADALKELDAVLSGDPATKAA
ncbi:MAG: putative Rossmann fold enzyme [Planctomycetota bacterium]|jgi:uncharacterized Rossmann fold enzyme